MDIQRWDFIEIAHEATAEREYPFRFVDFDATFTHIDSGHSVNISGYYDGDATWRLRFMPTELGTWRYLTSSNTPGLDGHEGRINCVAPSETYLRGPVATDGHHFFHADGTARLLLSTRLSCHLEAPEVWRDAVKYMQEHHINHLQRARLRPPQPVADRPAPLSNPRRQRRARL